MKRSIPLHEHPSDYGFEPASSGPFLLDGLLAWFHELPYRLTGWFGPPSSRLLRVVEITSQNDTVHYEEASAARIVDTVSEYRVTLRTPEPADVLVFVDGDRIVVETSVPSHRSPESAERSERRVHSFTLPKGCDDSCLQGFLSGHILTILAPKVGRRIRKTHALAMA